MRKRLMSAFLALCMVLTLLPGAARAESGSGSCGANVRWRLENGVLTISGSGAMYNYRSEIYHKDDIPREYGDDDIWVNSNWYYHITSPWFSHHKDIKHVVIEDGVTNIGNYAFCACENMMDITMPTSLTSIGKLAFWSCNRISRIKIPDGVTRIGWQAFLECENLTYVDIADSVTTIEQAAFNRCQRLSTVNLPKNITALADGTFRDCIALEQIVIPNGVVSLDGFSGCSSLRNINIPDSVTSIEPYAFSGCSSLQNITIPDSVTRIGSKAFSSCTSLTSIRIPASVTAFFNQYADSDVWWKDDIASFPFDNCTSIVEIRVDTGNPSYKAIDGVLYNKEGTILISYPAGKSGSTFTVPSSVSAISDYAFTGASNLTQVVLPEGIPEIPSYAFRNCTNLKNVNIPDSVTLIGVSAFSNCTNLQSIVIPEGVITLGPHAFENCTSLESIVIPEGATTLDSNAFENCTNLESITIPKSVTWIDREDNWFTFKNCNKLTIYCYKDSYAHQFAQDKKIPFVLLDEYPDPEAPAITLFPETLDLSIGATSEITVTTTPEGAEYTLTSSDPEVVSVSGTTLTAHRLGRVEVTAALADHPDVTAVCSVAVAEPDPETPAITLSPETLNLSVGETSEITVTTTPEGAEYTLTSSDPEVVSVSGTTLTAHKLGRVEVTAALVDHPDVTAVCSVAVKDGYDDLMCAIAACELSYENELIRYSFGAKVSVFADAAVSPERLLWNGYTDAALSDFYKDVLGDWTIKDVMRTNSGFFAVALDNENRNQRIIAYRGTDLSSFPEFIKDVYVDAKFAVQNRLLGQFAEAMAFYTRNSTGNRNILLTGHSLGGALACYVSLLTGERAELFNGANGLIIEDSYFVGGEKIYSHFHGTDRWNFINHVTDVAPASINYPIAYPNADKLPVEVHEPSSRCSSASLLGFDGHGRLSMLEYDESTARFRLTESTPYCQTLSDVRQFEMTRADALYFMKKVIDVYQLVKEPAVFILEQIIFSVSGLQGFLEEHIGAYEKVFFAFGSSGDDTIAAQKIIEQVFLFGGDGDDFLNGGCINDVLVGGLGRNAMDGGPMNDLYVITGTSDQYINDCSGVDDIYIPSGVRVRSYGTPTDKVDEYYVLTLTNGQRIMINKNRKQDFDNRFRVYSMDGTYCGSYRTVPQDAETRVMALAAEDEPAEAANGLPITTLEFSGRNLVLEIQDDAGNAVGTVNTASDSFPLYQPYGYFYYDSQAGTLRAHLFGGSGEVKVSSADPAVQTIDCTSIFHHAEDDLPVKRFTARVALQSSESILTPSCVAEEPAVPFKVMDSSGETQAVPTKTEDLTGSESPDVPVQPEQPSSGSGGWSTGTCAVTVEKPEHGKVTANRTNAASGSTVTLTVVPDSGYVLDTLTVADSRGNEIRLTAQGGGKYTFTMPGRAVTVTAIFTPLPDNEKEPCDGGADCPSHGFADLDTVGTWYHEAVDYVLQNNLMGGYGNGLFGPDDTLTRAQFAQILYNKAGRPVVDDRISFSDVADTAWYADAVSWAAERGIVSGYGGGRFGPDDNITREQLAVMLWWYSGSPAATNKELHFNDTDEISPFALEALRWAVENGIINGKGGGILDPKGPATRAQAAQILKNYLDK